MTITVFESVLDRIGRALSGSEVEEGGKLLGRMRPTQSHSGIQIETYIDSGPGIDHSASHIMPDGDYQEAVYRVLERFLPDLDHVGSWHSHHCNGLNQLSRGDVEGYVSVVNDPRYLSPFFVALLVTGLGQGHPSSKWFLFKKGSDKFSELPRNAIHISPETFPLEPLMNRLESLSTLARGGAVGPSTRAPDMLREIRAEDKTWLERQDFVGLTPVQNKQTGSVAWKWALRADGVELQVTYAYPPSLTENAQNSGLATLTICCDHQVLHQTVIPLTAARFQILSERINEALQAARR